MLLPAYSLIEPIHLSTKSSFSFCVIKLRAFCKIELNTGFSGCTPTRKSSFGVFGRTNSLAYFKFV